MSLSFGVECVIVLRKQTLEVEVSPHLFSVFNENV